MSESKLFEALEKIVKAYDKKWILLAGISEAIIGDTIETKLKEKQSQLLAINNDIEALERKASSLLDMKLEEKVSQELFEKKNDEITKDINNLKSRKEKIEKVNIEKLQAIQRKMVELSGSLYRSYKSMNNPEKSNLLKNVMVELSVSTKKELTIKENKLFKFIKCTEKLSGSQIESIKFFRDSEIFDFMSRKIMK